MKTDQNYLMKNFNMTRPFSLSGLASIVRFTALLCPRDSRILLGKVRRFLFFLVAAGFLSIVLTACAGGGGGSGSSSSGSMNNGSMDGDPGDNGPGNGAMVLGVFDASLTFAPIRGGFQIGSQSDFGDFTSLNITATSGSESEERTINIDEFADGSYDFTGLADRDWKFQIRGILSDGSEQEVDIVFVWQENRDDHAGAGIRSGVDTDGDRRADSVDDDDDNDGLDDNDVKERQMNSANVRCSLLVGCDGDSVTDMDEVAAACVIKADCDNDGARDGDEEAGCVQNTDCDNDGVGDGIEARGCAKLANCDGDSSVDGVDIDDDGDGLIEIATAAQLDEVRYALDGSGRKSSASGALDQTGCGGSTTTSCNGYELVADISLAAYANADGGEGWRPLGNDTDGLTDGCQGDAFNGTFEGNGWTISDLNINRSGEDCVGLFGYIAEGSEIRNLILRAERVIGRLRVGGLVGDGSSARIHSSSVAMEEIRGGAAVGGLVGLGHSVWIASSSVVVAEVIGIDISGPLSVFSRNYLGGLMGWGDLARIHSSSVVAGEVGGFNIIGGLVGQSHLSRIHSSSVVVGEVSGSANVGGLMGSAGDSVKVAYSYVVSGSNTNMLAGTGSGTGNASYWDSDTSGRNSGNHGEAKTSEQLQMPTGYDGIYASWDEDMNIFGDEDEPLAVWCDRDNSGSIEGDEKIDANLIWDFGTSSQYPAIRCTPLAPAEWRSWWSLEGTPAKPQLNRTRLDQLLP